MRLLVLTLLLCACAPAVVDEPWRIVSPRVIAVTADPPEAAPGQHVTLTAIVAGAESQTELRWAPCERRRPFAQNESVERSCIGDLDDAPVGGVENDIVLSADVCARFGPDAPGEGLRPRDPDSTGGWYQLVGVKLGEASSFASVRLWCRPAGVSLEVAQAWAAAARPNTNPGFTLSASIAGQAVDFDALPAGAALDLHADWSDSPEESFVVVEDGALQQAVERYDVSWFVTAGSLLSARSSSGTGRWVLPAEPGVGALWAVLRDDRGALAVRMSAARWQ